MGRGSGASFFEETGGRGEGEEKVRIVIRELL